MFHSFDGGGPGFSVVIADPEIVSYRLSSDRKADPYSTETGSSYNVICTLTGLRPGKTNVTVQERSPIADNRDHIYTVTVGGDMSMTVDGRGAFEATGYLAEMKMFINDMEIPVKWLWNDSALELSYMLPVTLKMSMYGGFEQVGTLSEYGGLPAGDERITYVVFFAHNSSYLDADEAERLHAFAQAFRGCRLSLLAEASTPGSREYNQALSERRLARVIDLLKGDGFSLDDLVPGYAIGEQNGIDTAEGRRVTITVESIQNDKNQ